MEMEKKRRYSADSYQDYKEGLLSKEEYLELKDSYHEDMKALLDEIKALKREYEEMLRMGKDKHLFQFKHFLNLQIYHFQNCLFKFIQ